MRIKNLRKVSKRAASFALSAALVVGVVPAQNLMPTVKAADDNTPYVISNGRMVYASSSVENSDPSYAVDGSTSTRWESSWNNKNEWMYVDLGKVTQITGVKLMWEGAYATAYKIQFSDDEENWRDVYTNNSCKGGNETIDLSGSARYVRIYMTDKALAAYGYSLYNKEEVEQKVISLKDVEEVISIGRYTPFEILKNLETGEVGHVYGLGVSGFLGSTIEIEATVFHAKKKGAGTIKFNDTAGSMAKDSVFNAASVIRKITDKDIKEYDIHVNVIGGGQIDGPSAGAAITICIISALLNRKIRQDVAITGEISLRGKVKPVGGIFEKIYGARRKGIKLVLVPKDNEKEIPLGLNDIEVRAVSNIEELMEIVFE